MTNAYLNARFEEKRQHKSWKRFIVPPLVSMSIGTLERGLSSLGKTSLSEILQQRIQGDKQLSRPFEAASSYISRSLRGALKHIEVLELLTEEMKVEFKMEDSNPAT